MTNGRNSSNYNIVDEIKSRCNIVDVIGRVVTLRKAGSVYKGLCPFHNEKTPSFVVYETTQTYKCFGCNEGGDVLNFVQKYYNLDFTEAVEMLAKEYGIDVTRGFGSSKRNEEFYEINRQAAIFFYRALRERKNPGYTYMRGRGISDDTLKTFGIGYADDGWTSLTDKLTGMGYDPEKLVEVGLTSKKDGRYYDYFRGRVIFPIRNTGGRVIGFGGRVLNDEKPKYLNSRESSAFRKKSNLYGLDIAKGYVSREDRIILVEGYMDVVSLYQAGVRNVSASLGTALTGNQARLIKRYTKNVILSYDSDEAGQKAALRGVDILYDEDCRASVLMVSEGKDPDEFIKANGRDAYIRLTEDALPYGDFKLSRARQKYDLKDDQQKLSYLREAINILRGMKPVEADLYIGKISAETGISEMAIRREYEGTPSRAAASSQEKEEKAAGMSEGEQDLIKLMLIDSEYTKLPKDVEDCVFRDQVGSSIFRAIRAADNGERPLRTDRITDQLDIEASEALREIEAKVIPPDKEEEIFRDCISYIRRQKLRKEDAELTKILDTIGADADPEDIKRVMQRKMEIQKIIKG